MIMSLTRDELYQYVGTQLATFFPDGYKQEGRDTRIAFENTLEMLEDSFLQTTYRHYCHDGQADFRHLYSDQYCMFLYLYSNTLWKQSQNKPICDKLVNLNIMLNGLHCPYTVNIPTPFLFAHPVGTVLGVAQYSPRTVFMQNVTVQYSTSTTIGERVVLCSGAKVVKDCIIGSRTSVGVNAVVHNKTIDDDSIVYVDEQGKLMVKKRGKACFADFYFGGR